MSTASALAAEPASGLASTRDWAEVGDGVAAARDVNARAGGARTGGRPWCGAPHPAARARGSIAETGRRGGAVERAYGGAPAHATVPTTCPARRRRAHARRRTSAPCRPRAAAAPVAGEQRPRPQVPAALLAARAGRVRLTLFHIYIF